jgi:glycosyltransferase involved in cell wall biosynthesis
MTELSSALASLGWRLRVYCASPAAKLNTAGDGCAREEEWQGISIRRVAPWGSHGDAILPRLMFAIGYTVAVLLRLVRDRRRLRAILVGTNPPFAGAAAVAAWHAFGTPYVVIVYDVYPDVAIGLGLIRDRSLVARLWKRVARRILADAAEIVVIGRDMEALVRGRIGNTDVPVVLIPNWSDEAKVHPVPREANSFIRENGLCDKFVVQYAGTMSRTHDLEPLVEAARLLASHRRIYFQFIGDGAKRERIGQLAAQYNLTNVQFLPHQPVSRLAESLSAANLSVVSLDRRFTGLSVPSKIYGAMAAAVPILALVDPLSEIGRTVSATACGEVINRPTPEAIAARILALADDPRACARMGAAGQRAFLANFTLRRASEQYDAVLKAVLGNCPDAAPASESTA